MRRIAGSYPLYSLTSRCMSIAVQPGHMNSRKPLCAVIVSAAVIGGLWPAAAPLAHAAPNPEVEYVYDMTVRRQYNFPNNDALAYGHGVCDKVGQGEGYGQVIGDVKRDVTPNDQFAANYVVGYAVNLLCPDLIWQLRNSAGGYYLSPDDAPASSSYY